MTLEKALLLGAAEAFTSTCRRAECDILARPSRVQNLSRRPAGCVAIAIAARFCPRHRCAVAASCSL